MAHGRNKFQSRESRAKMRGILLHEWDPIGVAGIPEVEDEYDSYADRVYVMLMDERATVDVIAAYLLEVAATQMGLGFSAKLADRTALVARALVALRPGFETH